MTPTARKSRRSGFLQDENPPRNRENNFPQDENPPPNRAEFFRKKKPAVQSGKIFSQDLFCEAHEKFSPQDKTQKPNRAENDPDPQEKLRERPPQTLPSFPEMPEK